MFWTIWFRGLRGAQLWNDERGGSPTPVICPIDPAGHRRGAYWEPTMFLEEPTLESPVDRERDALLTPGTPFVLKKRVFAAMQDSGLTGWLMRPCVVSFADGSESDDYGVLAVDGWGRRRAFRRMRVALAL